MANDVKHRQRLRGSSVQNDEYTGLEGEVTVDLTTPNLRIHDGKTPGGHVVAMAKGSVQTTQQTLTDAQIEQVKKNLNLTDEQITAIAQLVADKYLPLAGGTMTGNIVSNIGILSAISGGIDIGFSWGDRTGALIALRNKYHENSGGFEVVARNADAGATLIGTTSGSLKWGGLEVERLKTVASNYIRFAGGLQICWGVLATTTSETVAITLPAAFSDTSYVVIATDVGSAKATYAAIPKTTTTFTWYKPAINYGGKYIAIGRWK